MFDNIGAPIHQMFPLLSITTCEKRKRKTKTFGNMPLSFDTISQKLLSYTRMNTHPQRQWQGNEN
uniref:Uncharacterized protein n=1 Tax=Arundo donax TaxID=35708 RepID=A0A0A9H4J5_ARUDO